MGSGLAFLLAVRGIERPALAVVALDYGLRSASEGKCVSVIRSGILGIDNNHRYKRGPRKGQHRDEVTTTTSF